MREAGVFVSTLFLRRSRFSFHSTLISLLRSLLICTLCAERAFF